MTKRTSGNVTIVDVARGDDVSYPTGSRVLNNKGNAKPETRERMLRSVMRLGYVGWCTCSLADEHSQVHAALAKIGRHPMMKQEMTSNILGRLVDSLICPEFPRLSAPQFIGSASVV